MGPAQPADRTSARAPAGRAGIGVAGGYWAENGLSCAAHRACALRARRGAERRMRRRLKAFVDADFARLRPALAGAARRAGGHCNTKLEIGSVPKERKSGKVLLTA